MGDVACVACGRVKGEHMENGQTNIELFHVLKTQTLKLNDEFLKN